MSTSSNTDKCCTQQERNGLMTQAWDRCKIVSEAEARRLKAWAWAVPVGMGLCALGFVGAVVTIPAFDEGGLVASVIVLLVGATVACLGAMYGALPGRYDVARPEGEVDPNDDDGGGPWKVPDPTRTPPSLGEPPSPGGGVDTDPEWWPAFEPVLAGWLREGAIEGSR
jgi:hypothetical protein